MIELKVPGQNTKVRTADDQWMISTFPDDPYNFKIVKYVEVSDESIDRIADTVSQRLGLGLGSGSGKPNFLTGLSPEEMYKKMRWLFFNYGMQFADTREAIIEWLKENN